MKNTSRKINFVRLFCITLACLITFSILLSFCNFIFYTNNTDKNTIKNPEEVILVDVTGIINPGGIYTLSKYLISEISQKRPNWKLLIMHAQDENYLWKPLISKNVESFHIIKNYAVIGTFYFLFNILESLPNFIEKLPKAVKHFIGKVKFFLLYSRWLPDIDLFFDPVTTFGFNNFYYPRVTVMHDILYHDIPRFSFKYDVSKAAAESAAKYSDEIITISKFTKRRLIDVFGIDENKIHLIQTKLSKRLKSEIKNQNEILQKYALTSNNYIVYPSAFWPHKNHERLIKAFVKYKENSKTNLKLVMIGTAPPKKEILKEVPPELEKDIIVTDFINDNAFQAIIKNSKAVIQCSLYEGFGMTVLEGMAAGKVVAASKTASIPEVAEDAVLYFDPYEVDDICRAIHEITNNTPSLNILIGKGRKQVEKFSNKDQMIDEYIKVIEDTTNRETTQTINNDVLIPVPLPGSSIRK